MKDRNIKLSFCEVLGDLINKSGKTLTDIEKDTGLTASSLSKWRDGKSDICSVNLCILAEYFHVSTDYLLGLSKSQYRVDDLPENKKNLEYFISYTGLSKDSVDKLHQMKIDFTLTTLLNFLINNTLLLELTQVFFSFVNSYTDNKISSFSDIIEHLTAKKQEYRDYLDSRPKLKEEICAIEELKFLGKMMINSDLMKLYACPYACNSFTELKQESEILVQQGYFTKPIMDNEDAKEIELIEQSFEVLEKSKEFYDFCYTFPIGKMIIDNICSDRPPRNIYFWWD